MSRRARPRAPAEGSTVAKSPMKQIPAEASCAACSLLSYALLADSATLVVTEVHVISRELLSADYLFYLLIIEIYLYRVYTFSKILLLQYGPVYTIQYNTIQYNTIQYNTIQYKTIQ